jgi:hypothetical protein
MDIGVEGERILNGMVTDIANALEQGLKISIGVPERDVIEQAILDGMADTRRVADEHRAQSNEPDLDPEGKLIKFGSRVRAELMDYASDDYVEGDIIGYAEKGDDIYYIIQTVVELPTGQPSSAARARGWNGATSSPIGYPTVEVLFEREES